MCFNFSTVVSGSKSQLWEWAPTGCSSEELSFAEADYYKDAKLIFVNEQMRRKVSWHLPFFAHIAAKRNELAKNEISWTLWLNNV